MKANNFTISIPTPKCKKNCPYCICKMTGDVKIDKGMFWRNFSKAKQFALRSGVTSVLITGKGEPMDNTSYLYKVMEYFEKENLPIELQTNGKAIKENSQHLSFLYNAGLNVIAFSVDCPDEFIEFSDTFTRAYEEGLVIRVSIVLNERWSGITLERIIDFCKSHEISQLTFRFPTVPLRTVDTEESKAAQDWINSQDISKLKDLGSKLMSYQVDYNLIRILPFGAKVYDIEGVAVTLMDYCIQENAKEDDIRSLIYQTDGHLYTTWDKKSSILF